jgi:hypothetical protein
MDVSNWKRAMGFGFLSWLIPFATSFLLFPLKSSNIPLFDALMSIIVVITAAALASWYFRDHRLHGVDEAGALGMIWLAMNLVLDYPMFAYGPMQMTLRQYYSEIGVCYLIYPAFLVGAASLCMKQLDLHDGQLPHDT